MDESHEASKVEVKYSKEEGKCVLIWMDKNDKVLSSMVFPVQGVAWLLSALMKVEDELQKGDAIEWRTMNLITKYEAKPAAMDDPHVGILIESAPSRWAFAIDAEEAKSFAEQIRQAAEFVSPSH